MLSCTGGDEFSGTWQPGHLGEEPDSACIITVAIGVCSVAGMEQITVFIDDHVPILQDVQFYNGQLVRGTEFYPGDELRTLGYVHNPSQNHAYQVQCLLLIRDPNGQLLYDSHWVGEDWTTGLAIGDTQPDIPSPPVVLADP